MLGVEQHISRLSNSNPSYHGLEFVRLGWINWCKMSSFHGIVLLFAMMDCPPHTHQQRSTNTLTNRCW